MNNSGTIADNSDTNVNNSDTITDNLGIAVDNLGIAKDNLSIVADNPGIATNYPGITANHPGSKIDADVRVDNPGTAVSNKAYVLSFFALRRTFMFFASSFKLLTTFLPSFCHFYPQLLYQTLDSLKSSVFHC